MHPGASRADVLVGSPDLFRARVIGMVTALLEAERRHSLAGHHLLLIGEDQPTPSSARRRSSLGRPGFSLTCIGSTSGDAPGGCTGAFGRYNEGELGQAGGTATDRYEHAQTGTGCTGRQL